MEQLQPLPEFVAEMDVKLLSDRATLPTHGSVFAAVPQGHYGRIAPRSGLASKHGIQTGAGVIDSDYRGPVMVLLFNHSDVDFEVNPKDRIAQLILERISVPKLRQVESLDATVRGAGGFGSTGGFGPVPKKQKVEEEIVETTIIKRKEI
ncbi:hypothetical protein I312_105995 [Cryptococcus bacillisporus CA1280]|uniref:uncharacterized protein n=1 Tax=Cryptococcus bacillisporus CA1280 TaxID=1296109 RepID=UPI003366D5FF